MQAKNILTVTLNPVIDKTMIIPGFKQGYDFREKKLSLSAGGKGINVSQVLAHLGEATVATGFLGSNGRTYIREELQKQKIDNSFIDINGNVRTSITIIDPKTIKLTRIMEQGPVVKANECSSFKKVYKKLLLHASAVVLAGRSIPGAPDSLYAELIRMAHVANVPSVFDVSGKPYVLGIKEQPFMIKPNIEEAEAFLKMRIRSEEAIKKAVKLFYKRGIKIVAISRGSRGAYIYDGVDLLYACPPKVVRKNPVGCGDSFIAGFVAGYTNGRKIAECLQRAVACGSANAESFDPGDIQKKKVRALMKQVSIKKLVV